MQVAYLGDDPRKRVSEGWEYCQPCVNEHLALWATVALSDSGSMSQNCLLTGEEALVPHGQRVTPEAMWPAFAGSPAG